MSNRALSEVLACALRVGLLGLALSAAGALAQVKEPDAGITCAMEIAEGETPADFLVRAIPLETLCKRDVNFLFALGQLLNTLERYDQAGDRLEGVLMLQPDHWPAKLEYAIALDGVGERESADALLAQLEDEPNLPAALQLTIRERRKSWRIAAEPLLLWRQSLTLLGGYDNNLLGSTSASQLNLTLPNGTLPVVINPNARPRSGGFFRMDWRQDARMVSQDGAYWNMAFAANIRHAPAESATDFSLWGVSLERVSAKQQGPFVALTVQNLNTHSGDIYRLVSIGSGMDRGNGDAECRSRIGVEMQYRYFPLIQPYNGIFSGLLLQGQCPASGWYARLRHGYERAEYDNRPGGDQDRTGFLVGKQTTLGQHRFNFEIDYEHLTDREGFSPLLEKNLRRKINKTSYRLEYTFFTKIVEPVLGIEWLRQSSNLALYEIDTRVAYAGLRWVW